MASSKFEGLMINRLLVLIQLIFIPIYFFLFSIRWRDDLTYFFARIQSNAGLLSRFLPEWLIWFEIHLGIPIFFSLPWVLFTLFRATRIADSYELMGRALGRVRIDQKLFYGLNAAFTLIFLIFPFLSPLITIIGIFWAVRFIMRKLVIGKLFRFTWFIPALVFSFVPGLIAYAFYSNYVILFNNIYTVWKEAIPNLFGIGLSLAIAISIGNFFLFLSEGRKRYGTGEDIPYVPILIAKIFMFGLLLLVYFNTNPPTVVNIINYVAASLGIIELVGRKVKKMPSEDGVGSGMVMVLAFSFVNIAINALRHYTDLTQWIQTIVIVVSGLIFFLLFYLSYTYAPKEFGYPDDEPAKEPVSAVKDTEDEE